MLSSWNCLVLRHNNAHVLEEVVQQGLLLHVWRQNDVRFLSHAGKKSCGTYWETTADAGPVGFWQNHFSLKASISMAKKMSSKYSNNAATRYSALATTDRPWYRPQARSPALWCGYKIVVQRFKVHSFRNSPNTEQTENTTAKSNKHRVLTGVPFASAVTSWRRQVISGSWMWRQSHGHLLGRSGGMPPKEIFGILDVLRLHAVSASRIAMH